MRERERERALFKSKLRYKPDNKQIICRPTVCDGSPLTVTGGGEDIGAKRQASGAGVAMPMSRDEPRGKKEGKQNGRFSVYR